MSFAVDWPWVAPAVMLGGAVVALGPRLIRRVRRDAAEDPPSAAARPGDVGRPVVALRGIAAVEALKALVVLAAAWGLVAIAAHPDWVRAGLAILGHLGLAAGGQPASGGLAKWVAAERGPMLLGATAYAGLHLAEAWGLWHERPWGEALGVASGAVYLPFELEHLLHRPAWTSFALLALNLAVVSYLVWRLRTRSPRIRNAGGTSHQSA